MYRFRWFSGSVRASDRYALVSPSMRMQLPARNATEAAKSFSPATDPQFIAISGIVPAGATNSTPMEQRAQVHDAQLKGDNPAVYVDDLDFETLDLTGAMNYVLNLQKDDSAFMTTADGNYAAYIYVNSVDNSGKITVSIKRYPLK